MLDSTRTKLAALLRHHEGVRKFAYKCPAGFTTIGVGRNLDTRGLRPAEIECLLKHDIDETIEEVHEHWPWVEHLGEARRLALYDMAFNLGLDGFAKFGPTLALIRDGHHGAAANRLKNTKWYTQVGSRAHRITEMIRTGGWPDDVPV